ncbi:MAG: CvpA family protein, partial [Pirellulales bacterium]
MAPYDILMILVLAGATLFGAWKGMAWQIASVSSLVVSYLVALRFSPRIAHLFGQQAPFNRFLAMLAIYLGTSLVIWMV